MTNDEDWATAITRVRQVVVIQMRRVTHGEIALHLAAAELGLMPFEFEAIYYASQDIEDGQPDNQRSADNSEDVA